MEVFLDKIIIKTDKAPQAIGPYSQGVKVENRGLIFVSGQIPINPESGGLVSGSIGEETRQVLKNLKAILEEAGSGLDKVVKTCVFLKNMDDFAEMNQVYSEFFQKDPPARSTVEVSRLPKGVRIEVEAIAYF
jgi:2-iminobutanoate/2-iminopropanoate deaminase